MENPANPNPLAAAAAGRNWRLFGRELAAALDSDGLSQWLYLLEFCRDMQNWADLRHQWITAAEARLAVTTKRHVES